MDPPAPATAAAAALALCTAQSPHPYHSRSGIQVLTAGRRLQTLAVLWFINAPVLCLGLFFFLCAIPLLWPVLPRPSDGN